jgi:hypothetical protein
MQQYKNPKRRGGPRPKESQPADGMQQIFKLAKYQQSFDKEAFDFLIQGQGVKVTHFRAIPDPTGMASLGDVHAVQSKRQSSDGFLYKEVGCFHMFFSSNSGEWTVEVEGLTSHDTAVVTFPMIYEDKDGQPIPDRPVLIGKYDRFYMKDVIVRVIAMQYVEANTTGVDKLQYPATCVEHLIDADGKEYEEGVHFEITTEGFIKWTGQNRPGFNEKLGRGTVYSIRYRYTPYFVVARMLHETRVSQITDPMTFERSLERMPFQALIVREQVLSDMNRDPHQSIMDHRFQHAPPVGGVTGPNDEDPNDGGKL